MANFGQFLPTLRLNISRMAQSEGLWSFAAALYPFCLTSDQVSSKSSKWLARKCPQNTQKMHENWPFSSQIFSLKTKTKQKSDETYRKGNLSQILNIKSDFQQHLPFLRYWAFFGHHFCHFWPISELCGWISRKREFFWTCGFREVLRID